MKMNELHYQFYDAETREDFIVGAYNIGEAYDVAQDVFAFPVYTGVILTEEEAEASGWDEYKMKTKLYIQNAVALICGLILLWIGLSFLDIVAHNSYDLRPVYQSWNFFTLFF